MTQPDGGVLPRGPRYQIPDGTLSTRCRSKKCLAWIFWITTDTGKKMPVNLDGSSHFSTCVDADKWRKKP